MNFTVEAEQNSHYKWRSSVSDTETKLWAASGSWEFCTLTSGKTWETSLLEQICYLTWFSVHCLTGVQKLFVHYMIQTAWFSQLLLGVWHFNKYRPSKTSITNSTVYKLFYSSELDFSSLFTKFCNIFTYFLC